MFLFVLYVLYSFSVIVMAADLEDRIITSAVSSVNIIFMYFVMMHIYTQINIINHSMPTGKQFRAHWRQLCIMYASQPIPIISLFCLASCFLHTFIFPILLQPPKLVFLLPAHKATVLLLKMNF